ncbi:hypothetical protein BDW59DRAFT_167563 [Aspergillus cavernicola]|uniref:RZ-type domain-containing protein n=1 Tax=Aspergillus cavernicola TaxID=176166 RepID=A0ABR4HCY7_9EURO
MAFRVWYLKKERRSSFYASFIPGHPTSDLETLVRQCHHARHHPIPSRWPPVARSGANITLPERNCRATPDLRQRSIWKRRFQITPRRASHVPNAIPLWEEGQRPTQTPDGHVGMSEAYEADAGGELVALRQSSTLSQFVPRCPDCQCPIQQYATQRYNRGINKAVLDGTSRRFILNGNTRLRALTFTIEALEKNYHAANQSAAQQTENGLVQGYLDRGYTECESLAGEITRFIAEVSDAEQPATPSLADVMPGLSPDQRVVRGSQAVMLKLQYTIANAHIEYRQIHGRAFAGPNQQAIVTPESSLTACEEFITSSMSGKFPRLCVEVQLYYGRIAFLYQSVVLPSGTASGTETSQVTEYVVRAKEYIQQAAESLKLLNNARYEAVTKEELDAIKLAMVSGRSGLATHSGHWYNCANEHLFAVGECGIPTELARCPECRANVGGA